MEQLTQQFHDNPWIPISGYLVGILGLILSLIGIVLTLRSLKNKRPAFFLHSLNLIQGISNEYDKLKVIYDGQEVENVTVAKLFFWNAGKDTIRGDDIASSDPIKIRIEKGVLLDIQIISGEPSNHFDIQFVPGSVECLLTFEYMDYNDMVAIQIIHTGDEASISFKGKIMGSQSPFKRVDFNKRQEWVLWISLIAGVLVFGIFLLGIAPKPRDVGAGAALIWGVCAFLLLVLAVASVFFLGLRMVGIPNADEMRRLTRSSRKT